MKFYNWVIFVIILFVVLSILLYFLPITIQNRIDKSNKEYIITDKWSNDNFYFELNNTYYCEVYVYEYYNYEIGDTFIPTWRHVNDI